MKPLALTLALCALVASGSAAAEQTCKAKATQQKLAGEALISFVKQCESDALMGCTNQAAGKPDPDSFMDACVAKAVGAGPRWCVPHYCKENSDCRGGVGCGVCWGGLTGRLLNRRMRFTHFSLGIIRRHSSAGYAAAGGFGCPLVAHSGRATRADECLLWREERTWGAYDPKRTLEISGSAHSSRCGFWRAASQALLLATKKSCGVALAERKRVVAWSAQPGTPCLA